MACGHSRIKPYLELLIEFQAFQARHPERTARKRPFEATTLRAVTTYVRQREF
jgi:hypothetical protein